MAKAWLYQAAPSHEAANEEWTTQGIAVLTAGIVWDAVRVPYTPLGADLDHHADPAQPRRRLAEPRVTSTPGPYWVTLPDGTGPLTDPQHLHQALAAKQQDALTGAPQVIA
ncbi:hypothetical protein [Streptomyces shenzhenensis]|uniref:Uncharacterized protein n=1 Tax=Streptomyces shenzhenensis TaxID=943815 RepID=A0A3M0IAQ2_9ACTN|nr:hypothetical protein [Streptomyces shenzhenensis]RMB86157.1 hypothetical protein CTZ28_07685 [Streptomyces shenzhenensis]